MLAPAVAALVLAAAPNPPAASSAAPLPGQPLGDRAGVTGMVRVHSAMAPSQPNGLRPRDVFVWLPPGYDSPAEATRRYPVLYMHDGQNCLDPSTAFLGREWHADEQVDAMVRRGELPPIIIVAIANTPERVADYTARHRATVDRHGRPGARRSGGGAAAIRAGHAGGLRRPHARRGDSRWSP